MYWYLHLRCTSTYTHVYGTRVPVAIVPSSCMYASTASVCRRTRVPTYRNVCGTWVPTAVVPRAALHMYSSWYYTFWYLF
eukprot:SAG11_NODE_19928_length_456_cov_0.848739_1_plen_79_part_01